ncbi:uncharacterized protein LOC143914767 [Arctopsyche grandis]|uniref:uncharacterized protein LOC143914767 n=1 Tax=Arctopsyche grandis TaxID=121162 RepID=UPI00406D6BB6
MPNHKPSVMTFAQNGFTVKQDDDAAADCSRSKCNVVLDHMSPAASGAYTCEVSTEAPTFRTYMNTKNMSVAALPAGEPVLEGFRGAYNTGESFDVTCRTSASLPPARINLYINNEEVDEKNVSRLVMPVENELFVSVAQLKLVLNKKHFSGGLVLKLKCLATLMSVPSSARSVTGTATMGESQPLRNQKLKWQNSASRVTISTSKKLILSILCLRWIMLVGWADFFPS